MKGGERREQILHTAVSLFSQHGFSGTTTKEIARAAGVSEAMVFRHFASKDVLYGAILASKKSQDGMQQFPWEQDDAIQEAIAKKDDFAVFYNLGLRAMEKHQSDVGFMRLLFYSALEEHELAERFFNEFISRIYDFIANYIETRQRDGAFREVNPRIVVRSFLGMLVHHSLNNILWDKKRTLLDISNEDAAKNFAEVLLHGVTV